jgi:hypothetical protein
MLDSRLAAMPMPSRRRHRSMLLVAALLAAAVALAACGDDATVEDSGGDAPAESAASDLEHIHGLGVHPRNGTLYIATHFGLFTAASGETKMQRIGESRQDIMGFSVMSAGRFIGSGHPDPADPELPPNLGLIESTDGGKSWRPVSLLGEADFHVLESDGNRVYGFDGTQSRLMVSDDGGKRWDQRTPPAPMFDLTIDPTDRDRIVAATEAGLLESRNAGEDWQPLSRELAGLLAWPARDRLYLVDGNGQVQLSEDGGRRWRAAGSIGGQPAAFTAHGQDLYAALHDGVVKASADSGQSWVVRAAP